MLKPLYVMGAAIATTLLAAGAASAQQVEIIDERSGEPCLFCTVHLDGESIMTALPSGVTVSTCEDEYEVDFFVNDMEWRGTAHGGPGCNITNCVILWPHWSFTTPTESFNGRAVFNIDICLRAGGQEIGCTLFFAEFVPLGSHQYELKAEDYCAGGARHYELEAVTEQGDDNLELVHHQ